ncbi:O-antigen/teichoic acid export membrane protein [Pseudorhizobium tarimense]|uniref:O-antigen/teichoic acid export membrane protein n=2 Tax=Pseudorhizobium tarimense TaxID=1079109 RepID=A0ABV2H4A8_9HYPH|nr:oligosaccharide flippase family protein [Pseudorhizobium tarimense]
MYDTALSIAALRALAIVAVLCATAWPLSLLYHEPRLVALQCALSLAPAMRGLLSQKLTEYARVMDFRRDVVLEIIAKGGALHDRHHAGYHHGQLLGHRHRQDLKYRAGNGHLLLPCTAALSVHAWRMAFVFRRLGWNAARQLLSAVNWQADRVVLPRYVDTGTFGQFTWADNLVAVPAQAIIQPITPPLFSAFVMARQAAPSAKST